MRDDIRLDGWRICAAGAFCDDFLESVFFSGNGRMGVRGYAAGDPSPRPVQHGMFLAGMFDEIKPGITDLIHLPTPVWHRITVNGTSPALQGKVRRILDLSCGQLIIEYHLQCHYGILQVTEERFFDPDRPALLCERLTISSADKIPIEVESGIFSASCNCPVPDDQVKDNQETICLMEEEPPEFSAHSVRGRWRSRITGLSLQEDISFSVRGGTLADPFYRPGENCGILARGEPAPGIPFVLEKCSSILTDRDKDPRISPLCIYEKYDSLFETARQHWERKWDISGISLKGDDDAQTALRYITYQLICSYAGYDDTVNIGARGLTHTRYKGCYFWDTDLFIMPFFLYTNPPAARSLMQYRVNCLPQARAHAMKMNGAGARYPWMASYDGTEQCESWDIGASEVHVTADVAYAMDQYVQISGDESFSFPAYQVYIETARFWVSRYTPEPGTGKVNLLFCKGPDEYCGITSNNLFTNVMVQHNLSLAVTAAQTLRREHADQYAALKLCDAEVDSWRQLCRSIKVPRDPVTGHLRTDDTFHLLEPVELSSLKQGSGASYHNVCFDRLQRYQVVKQADTLLLMTRLPALFTPEEKKQAWDDFEPKCLHDSTLSFASHALFAAQNNLAEAAAHYFEQALYLDLREIMGNTGKEGLHLACFGETWQTVVFGFAGLHIGPEGPALLAHLPAGWEELEFRFYWHGQLYEAYVCQDGSSSITHLNYP
ncbi:hypothetical protein [Diplocloster hominis]|uniref:hypothetical protein n=1 Tax=Diplocloster hominis TaxID=3079010 RepID=UPI0031BA3CEC